MVDIQLIPREEGDQEEAFIQPTPRISQQDAMSCPLQPINESPLKFTPLSKTNNQSTAATAPANTIDYTADDALEYQKRRRKRWLIGYLFAVGVTLSVSTTILLRYNDSYPKVNSSTGVAILDYLDLYRWSNHSFVESKQDKYKYPKNTTRHLQENRHLLGTSSGDPSDYPQLVVAGKITVEGGPCNIAQFNLKTKEWSLTERIQLSLYNSYSGGEVYSLLANHTFLPAKSDTEDSESSSGTIEQHAESTFRRYV